MVYIHTRKTCGQEKMTDHVLVRCISISHSAHSYLSACMGVRVGANSILRTKCAGTGLCHFTLEHNCVQKTCT